MVVNVTTFSFCNLTTNFAKLYLANCCSISHQSRGVALVPLSHWIPQGTVVCNSIGHSCCMVATIANMCMHADNNLPTIFVSQMVVNNYVLCLMVVNFQLYTLHTGSKAHPKGLMATSSIMHATPFPKSYYYAVLFRQGSKSSGAGRAITGS